MSLYIPSIPTNSGPHTISLPDAYRLTSAGKNIPGTKTKIMAPDDEGNGEVRHEFMIGSFSHACYLFRGSGILNAPSLYNRCMNNNEDPLVCTTVVKSCLISTDSVELLTDYTFFKIKV